MPMLLTGAGRWLRFAGERGMCRPWRTRWTSTSTTPGRRTRRRKR